MFFVCLFTTAYFLLVEEPLHVAPWCTSYTRDFNFTFYTISLRLALKNPLRVAQQKSPNQNFRISKFSKIFLPKFFRNSKWFAWFPGQITINRIIIISHDFLMTFSDLLKFWPFFSYLSPQVLLHSDWSKRASHKITRHTSFIRDVSNSALTNSKTRYVSRFSHFSRFFITRNKFSSMSTWCE